MTKTNKFSSSTGKPPEIAVPFEQTDLNKYEY